MLSLNFILTPMSFIYVKGTRHLFRSNEYHSYQLSHWYPVLICFSNLLIFAQFILLPWHYWINWNLFKEANYFYFCIFTNHTMYFNAIQIYFLTRFYITINQKCIYFDVFAVKIFLLNTKTLFSVYIGLRALHCTRILSCSVQANL